MTKEDEIRELVRKDMPLREIAKRLDTTYYQVQKMASQTENVVQKNLEEKIAKFLSKGDMTLRHIASELNTTYYKVQKSYAASWTTVVTHHRTIMYDGFEFQVRMLPYGITSEEMTKKEAQQLIEKGDQLPQAIEIRMGNTLWLDFDHDQLEGTRQQQISFFYNTLNLAHFALSVSLNLDFCLTEQSLPMLGAFFSYVKKRRPDVWPGVERRIRYHETLGKKLAEAIL